MRIELTVTDTGLSILKSMGGQAPSVLVRTNPLPEDDNRDGTRRPERAHSPIFQT